MENLIKSVSLQIETGNAAFNNLDFPHEVARILVEASQRIADQTTQYLAGNGSRMAIFDANGNRVGFIHFEAAETSDD